jgi:hypothetical protein
MNIYCVDLRPVWEKSLEAVAPGAGALVAFLLIMVFLLMSNDRTIREGIILPSRPVRDYCRRRNMETPSLDAAPTADQREILVLTRDRSAQLS